MYRVIRIARAVHDFVVVLASRIAEQGVRLEQKRRKWGEKSRFPALQDVLDFIHDEKSLYGYKLLIVERIE